MQTVTPIHHRIRQPRQDRSRVSLERILRATEELIELKPLEHITIAEIVRRSRTSVGAFYTRFDGKEVLVPCLYERYDHWLERVGKRVFAERRWEGLSLERRVRRLARLATIGYRRKRGLIRAMALHARTHPDAITTEQRTHRETFYRAAAALLLACRAEITHPRPDEAVEFALFMLGAIARERILFAEAPHAGTVGIPDRRLAAEIAAAMLAYLLPGRGPAAHPGAAP